ncbi:MAG: DJ-1/PfpI family protein [Propionibacterium acidifaciens]|uniref:DJ-1/PfpI family protein n=1 Tax=Propionibacterium acidifaciens TaxID=556499 RepID=UPI0036210268
MKHICMYVQDTMADWEHGYLLHGVSLQGATPTPVCTMSFAADARDAVTTAGGMRIIPDETLAETDAEGIDAFVLIGGDTWLSENRHAALDLAEAVLAGGGIVAAICGATLGLASRGLLNNRGHTSNAPELLAAITAYRGNDLYEGTPATADRNVITAGSAGSLLWAKLILEELELYGKDVLDAWFDYFRTADPAHFTRMTRALEAE